MFKLPLSPIEDTIRECLSGRENSERERERVTKFPEGETFCYSFPSILPSVVNPFGKRKIQTPEKTVLTLFLIKF